MNRVYGAEKQMWRSILVVCAAGVAPLLWSAGMARGDVGPPISIKMPPERTQAVNGQPYRGEFVLVVFERGHVSDLQLVGPGWTVDSIHPPATSGPLDAGTYRVPFVATPQDAEAPLTLELKFNGRVARRQYRIGPSVFAHKGKPRLLISTNTPYGQQAHVQPLPPATEGDGPAPHGGSLIVHGRIMYNRLGVDRSNPPDGDFNDPEDSPPISVGADGVMVELWDIDPITDELMWRGLTNETGHFTSPSLDADVDTDGSGPDLKLMVYAKRSDQTGVFDPDTDDFYFWQTPEIENFNGSTHNFGTLSPQNSAHHPALHVFNSLVRTRRFVLEKPGYSAPPVRVVWPVAEWSHYQAGPQEIHLFEDHSWREDVVAHEFGHHFIYSLHLPPPVNYDNCGSASGPADSGCSSRSR